MNYSDPKLREMLAGEYVLGTLHGPARRRFERWLEQDAALRRLVDDWEARLTPLAEGVAPIDPPARVWQAVQSRIAPPRRRVVLWDCLNFWRTVGLVGGALALALLIYIGVRPSFVPPPTYIAVLNDNRAHPAWMVSATAGERRIVVQALTAQRVTADKALQLWLLPGAGQSPRSLGLLPRAGTEVITVPASLRRELAPSANLAISLEPAGGSPTGLPTGPVLYQGPWLRVSTPS